MCAKPWRSPEKHCKFDNLEEMRDRLMCEIKGVSEIAQAAEVAEIMQEIRRATVIRKWQHRTQDSHSLDSLATPVINVEKSTLWQHVGSRKLNVITATEGDT